MEKDALVITVESLMRLGLDRKTAYMALSDIRSKVAKEGEK